MCRMWRFLAILRSFYHSSLLQNISFHPFPPTNLPSSLTSSCHLFFGLPMRLVASKFIYNTLQCTVYINQSFSNINWYWLHQWCSNNVPNIKTMNILTYSRSSFHSSILSHVIYYNFYSNLTFSWKWHELRSMTETQPAVSQATAFQSSNISSGQHVRQELKYQNSKMMT